MSKKGKKAQKAALKRSGLVYSLYRKNMRNLSFVALALLALCVVLFSGSVNYLRNYCFPFAGLDMEQITAGDSYDLSAYDTSGERPPSGNVSPDMFELISDSGMYTHAYYQGEDEAGSDYRFRLVLEDVEEIGVYYDNLTGAYYDCPTFADCQAKLDADNVTAKMGEETYAVDRLLLVTINGEKFLAAATCTESFEPGQRVRVVFSQMDSCYLYDAALGGCDETVNCFYADLRNTPVDYEDEDFKDAVLLIPVSVIVVLLAVFFWIVPIAHPIYRQLAKYGKTIPAVADKINAEYESGEGMTRDKKTIYMPTFMITRSFFMYVIKRNHMVENKASTLEQAKKFQEKQVEASKNSRYRR